MQKPSPEVLMEILVKGLTSGYQQEHLTRLFYAQASIRRKTGTRGNLVYARVSTRHLAVGVRTSDGACVVQKTPRSYLETEKETGLALSRLLYGLLRRVTGICPPWGMLTGVRPVRLLRTLQNAIGEEAAHIEMVNKFDLSEEKYALAHMVMNQQRPLLNLAVERSYSLYISIPFCPSRCTYCSFVSRTIEREGSLVDDYLQKLHIELQEISKIASECGLELLAIYVGGGTPTALSYEQLERLLRSIAAHFNTGAVAEYTVEAGRPDCTTSEKLALLKEYGVGRVSINPQSMDDEVLRAIGRRHTGADVLRCFEDARRTGFSNINMDIIAGLPADDETKFARTLKQLIALGPESITVHTLTLKRSSNLAMERTKEPSSPGQMLAEAYPLLKASGYMPYYLYRQKSTPENLENTGWAKPGKASLYNVFIMEECQTILAAGAGGSTKLVGQQEQKIQRIFNPKYPVDYCSSFAQVLGKKRGVNDFYACNLDT